MMAGDWLKVEVCTPDKPEVIGIADLLGIAPAHAFGSLFLVWRWFDQHTTEGNASYVTKVTVDRLSGNAGFADAMIKVGWLFIQDDGIVTLPHFDRHNGETAKQRALTAKRVAKSKAKSNGKGNGLSNDEVTDDALPREEKRREEVNTTARTGKKLPVRAVTFDPESGIFQGLNGQIPIWQRAYPAISIEVEVNKAAAWLVANPKNRKSNYSRFLANWLCKAQDNAKPQGNSIMEFKDT